MALTAKYIRRVIWSLGIVEKLYGFNTVIFLILFKPAGPNKWFPGNGIVIN